MSPGRTSTSDETEYLSNQLPSARRRTFAGPGVIVETIDQARGGLHHRIRITGHDPFMKDRLDHPAMILPVLAVGPYQPLTPDTLHEIGTGIAVLDQDVSDIRWCGDEMNIDA